MSDRHRDATLCSAIELGDDDAIEVECLVELTCLLKAVLPRGRIDDEHGIDRQLRTTAHHFNHFGELAHQIV